MIALAEGRAPYEPRPALLERDLTTLWHGQRFPPGALVTTRGEELAVVFRGRPGRGPGPDFRDAIIALPDNRLLHGDVELHVRSSDYLAHGHLGDPAYDAVVLHLVFEDDLGPVTALGSHSLRTVALDRWLAHRSSELQRWLAQPPLWQEPCHTAVARQGEEHVAAVLRRTGLRRFEEHVSAAERDLAAGSPGQVLLAAIFDGLGYSQNRAPFRALAALLAEGDGDDERLEGRLFSAAGFLDAQPDVYSRELAFAGRGFARQPLAGWRLWGLRPENHPHRRLAGGVRLYRRLEQAGGALTALAEVLSSSADRLRSLLTVPADGYWAEHLSLGRPGRGPALIGPVRSSEIAVNAVLPFFVAFGETQGRDDLAAAARTAYAVFPPAGDYGITRPVARALRAGRRAIAHGTVEQQGLLYLFRNYCSRGRCLECAFNE